ncbi:undecaprenyldiphospho-muramoylpentapeptide beta-N-acetylglucosaminyltransferase [Paenibacillus sp. HB172176]|uniref:undecaprenyldiphospho-muramoylpentapeptide beta-N-acetylglucosaminyltransferase n=1 Tax=Paenibacillus sp. HB172176 TaxID=2493690 RepID=UPI00143943AD|nr:undecaprenyldiphospho-muramoylpentapeptide beta-N-acetylglucosaminyltransferase [Paenibacillus sp. HB172176]
MPKKILFTGGGTAGHVTVNLALIPYFQKDGWEVKYMGSMKGIEAELIEPLQRVEYIGIATGKLRRYFSWQNVKDPFRVIQGLWQAYREIRSYKPNVVFSKGGFVSVPVVIAAWLNRVPVVIHESDITPGLANRISVPYATKVCYTFPETGRHLSKEKSVHVGAVVRDHLRSGNKLRGLHFCEFTQEKPVLLVMGGSQGARKINQQIRDSLDALLQQFQIVHLCGKGQVDESKNNIRGYKQFEYIREELADVLAMTSIVVSRAGSNSIFEFLALEKPMLLIPLSLSASRGDQLLNAQSFLKQGYCEVLEEEHMSDGMLLERIQEVYARRDELKRNMRTGEGEDPLQKLLAVIKGSAR